MKGKLIIFSILMLILVNFAAANVIINEVMYDPIGTDSTHEWIELYNNGSQTINMSGWKLFEAGTNHGLTLLNGSENLTAGSYAIIADDGAQFLLDHNFTGNLFDSTFSLSNSGETISIKNSSLDNQSIYTYDNTYASENNKTIERVNYVSNFWAESLAINGTPGTQNSVYDVTSPVANFTLNSSVNEDVAFDINSTSTDNVLIKFWNWVISYVGYGQVYTNTTENLTMMFSEPGTYEVNLTVTDYANLSNTKSQNVIVNDTTAPVITEMVNASNATYEPSVTQFFSANITDNVAVDSINFSLNGDIQSLTNVSDIWMFNQTLNAGNYTAKWIINDTTNNVAQTSDYNFTIAKANSSINLTLNGVQGNVVINEGENYTINATKLIGEGNIYVNVGLDSYNDSSNVTFTNQSIDNGIIGVTATYPETTNYLESQLSYNITINDLVPTGNFSVNATTIDEGQSVFVNASTSTGSVYDAITNYYWDFSFNGSFSNDGFNVVNSTTFNQNGTYMIGLLVEDEDSNSSFVNKTIIVNDLAPVANFTVSNLTPDEDVSVQFNASVSDGKVDGISSYSWLFGDGSIGTGIAPTHTYTLNGSYVVKLTVIDNDGSTDTFDQTVNVQFVNDNPVDNLANEINLSEDFGTYDINLTANMTDEEDSVLTYAVLNSPIRFTYAINNGILRLSSISNVNGVDSINVNATDSGNLSVNKTIAINVASVNDVPVISTIPNQIVSEDTVSSINLSDYVSDIETNFNSLVITQDNGNNSISNGMLYFNYSLPYVNHTITLSVNDSETVTTSTFNVSINAVNDAPEFGVFNATINEDSVGNIVLNLSDYYIDEENNNVTFSVVNYNSNVECSIFNSTYLNVTPASNFAGTGYCNATVSDVTLSDSYLIPIYVTEVDDNISIANVSDVVFDEDSNSTLALSITNTDNANLIISLTNEGNVSAVQSGNSLIINSSANYFGSSEHQVRVMRTDNGQIVASNTFNVNVTAVNDAPTSLSFPLVNMTEENTTIFDVSPYFTDIENDNLTYAITQGSNTNASIVNSTLNISLVQDFFGLVNITVTANDSDLTVDNVLTINVSNVNDAPVVSSTIGNITWAEDANVTVDLSQYFSDVDNDTLTYTITDVANVTETVNGNNLTLSSDNEWYGMRNVTIRTADGSTNVTQNATLIVTYVNDQSPVFTTIPTITITEDGSNVTDLSAYVSDLDTDVSNLTFSLVNSNNDLTVSFNGTNMTVTPDANYNGTTAFILKAYDGQGFDTETVNVIVNGVEDVPSTPVLTVANNTNVGSSAYTLTWNASTDGDNDAITYDVYMDKVNGTTLLNSTSSTSYAVTLEDNSTYKWKVVANDTKGTNSSDVYVLTTTFDQAPTLTVSPIGNVNMDEFESQLFNVSANDPENATLTYVWKLDDVNVGTSTSYTYTPGASDSGNHNVSVSVSDGNNTVSNLWAVAVGNANAVPTVSSIPTINVNEDSSVSINLSQYFTDADGDTLTYTASGNNLTTSISNDNLTITPDTNFNGNVTFTINATDGSASVVGTTTVAVSNVNDAPTMVYAPTLNAVMYVGESREFSVDVTDIDSTPTISWYVDDVFVSNTSSKYVYTASSTGKIKAVINDSDFSETKEWNVTVSSYPVTLKFTGSTTNFANVNVTKAVGVIIENVNEGKIDFGAEALNLERSIDLDNYVIIKDGIVAVDTTNLPGFNGAGATITMTGLSFNSAPVIYYTSAFTNTSSSINNVCTATTSPSCNVVSYSNGVLVFTVSHFTSFRAVDSDNVYNVKWPSEVVLSDERSSNIDKSFVIENNGTQTLNNIVLKLDELKTLNLKMSLDNSNFNTTLNAFTLTPGQSKTIYLDGRVPSSFESGKTEVAKIELTSDELNETYSSLYVDTDSVLKISRVELNNDRLDDGDRSDSVKPGDKIRLEIKAENTGDIDINNVEALVSIDDLNIDENTNSVDIRDGDDKTYVINFKVPIDANEDTYDIKIRVEGEDDNGAYQDDEWTVRLDVEKESHAVTLYNVDLSRDSITCTQGAFLSIDVANIGQHDEDVKLIVKSEDFATNYVKSWEINEGDKKYTSIELTPVFNLSLGSYTVPIELYRDGSLEESTSVTLSVDSCTINTDVKSDKTNNVKTPIIPINPSNYKRKQVNPWTNALLICGIIILMGFVIFIIGVVMIKEKRRKQRRKYRVRTNF